MLKGYAATIPNLVAYLRVDEWIRLGAAMGKDVQQMAYPHEVEFRRTKPGDTLTLRQAGGPLCAEIAIETFLLYKWKALRVGLDSQMENATESAEIVGRMLREAGRSAETLSLSCIDVPPENWQHFELEFPCAKTVTLDIGCLQDRCLLWKTNVPAVTRLSLCVPQLDFSNLRRAIARRRCPLLQELQVRSASHAVTEALGMVLQPRVQRLRAFNVCTQPSGGADFDQEALRAWPTIRQSWLAEKPTGPRTVRCPVRFEEGPTVLEAWTNLGVRRSAMIPKGRRSTTPVLSSPTEYQNLLAAADSCLPWRVSVACYQKFEVITFAETLAQALDWVTATSASREVVIFTELGERVDIERVKEGLEATKKISIVVARDDGSREVIPAADPPPDLEELINLVEKLPCDDGSGPVPVVRRLELGALLLILDPDRPVSSPYPANHVVSIGQLSGLLRRRWVLPGELIEFCQAAVAMCHGAFLADLSYFRAARGQEVSVRRRI